jgi:MFS family permease
MLTAMAIVGLAIGAAMTTSFTAAGSVLPRHAHGAGFGFLGSASLTGFALSPIVSGVIAGRSIRAVFFFGVGVLLLMALIVRRVMVETPPRVEAAPAVEES